MNENVSGLIWMTESDLAMDCETTVGSSMAGSIVRTDAVRLSVTILVSSLRCVDFNSALLMASTVLITDDVTCFFYTHGHNLLPQQTNTTQTTQSIQPATHSVSS